MPTTEEQLAAVEQIHKEYLAELAKLTTEEQAVLRDFLERVRQKRIQEIHDNLMN